jgi:hypothetical protein
MSCAYNVFRVKRIAKPEPKELPIDAFGPLKSAVKLVYFAWASKLIPLCYLA